MNAAACKWSLALLGVVVLGQASAGAHPADNEGFHTVRGRITEVRPADNELTLRSLRGDELKLTVDPRSRLEIQHRPAKLGDFQDGMRVRVTYESAQGKNRVVTMTQPRVSIDSIQNEVSEALESAKSYSYQQKDEYQKKLGGVMQDLDDHMQDLKAKAAQAGEEARKRYQQEMEELRPKREALRKKLEQVRAAAPGAWDDIKSGVGAAAHDLQRALERVRARLQEQPPPKDKESR